MLNHILNFLLFSFGKTVPIVGPLRVHWDITEMCNSRCRHCTRWKVSNNKNELTYEECLKVIDDLKKVGTKAISFSGNEPLMRKDIYKIIKYANKKGFSISLNTNGLLLNEKNVEDLISGGVESFVFSLDSCRPEEHDSIRGVKGAFEKMFAGVEIIKKKRVELNKKATIQATIVVNRENVKELQEIVELCEKRGINKIVLQPIHNIPIYFESEKRLMLTKKDFPELEKQIRKILTNHRELIATSKEYLENFKTFFENPLSLFKYRCEAGFITCDLRANGDVVPCPSGFVVLGNLRKDSFKDIWFSSKSNAIRKDIKRNKHPLCWFACIQPINILAHNVKFLKIKNIFDKTFIKHVLSKLK